MSRLAFPWEAVRETVDQDMLLCTVVFDSPTSQNLVFELLCKVEKGYGVISFARVGREVVMKE